MPETPPPPTEPDWPVDGAYVRRQHAALRDLLELSAECARQDQQIELRFEARRDHVATRHDRIEGYLQSRLTRLRDETEARQQTQCRRLETRIEQDRSRLADDHARRLQQIREQGTTDQDALKQQLNQALWLADSVFEGAEAEVKQEQGERRDGLAAQREALETIESQADHLLQQYRQPYTLSDLPVGDQPAPSGAPAQVYRFAFERVGRQLAMLQALSAPKWFFGWRLWLAVLLPMALAGALAYGITAGSDYSGGGLALT